MKRKFHQLWGISRLKLNWCEHQLNKVLHKMPTCKRKLHHQKKQKFMSLLTRRLKNTGYENIRGIFLLTYIANGEKKSECIFWWTQLLIVVKWCNFTWNFRSAVAKLFENEKDLQMSRCCQFWRNQYTLDPNQRQHFILINISSHHKMP